MSSHCSSLFTWTKCLGASTLISQWRLSPTPSHEEILSFSTHSFLPLDKSLPCCYRTRTMQVWGCLLSVSTHAHGTARGCGAHCHVSFSLPSLPLLILPAWTSLSPLPFLSFSFKTHHKLTLCSLTIGLVCKAEKENAAIMWVKQINLILSGSKANNWKFMIIENSIPSFSFSK